MESALTSRGSRQPRQPGNGKRACCCSRQQGSRSCSPSRSGSSATSCRASSSASGCLRSSRSAPSCFRGERGNEQHRAVHRRHVRQLARPRFRRAPLLGRGARRARASAPEREWQMPARGRRRGPIAPVRDALPLPQGTEGGVVPVPLLREQEHLSQRGAARTRTPERGENRRDLRPARPFRLQRRDDDLGRPAHAEAATEDAFRSLRYDEEAQGDPGRLRTHLLRLAYAAATGRATARAPSPPLPALLTHAPLTEHQALVLCLHGVTCAALDASEGAPPGTAALRLHRALRQARGERSAHRRRHPADEARHDPDAA